MSVIVRATNGNTQQTVIYAHVCTAFCLTHFPPCLCVWAGEFYLFCKGADSSIFPRVVSGKVDQVRARVERNAVVSLFFFWEHSWKLQRLCDLNGFHSYRTWPQRCPWLPQFSFPIQVPKRVVTNKNCTGSFSHHLLKKVYVYNFLTLQVIYLSTHSHSEINWFHFAESVELCVNLLSPPGGSADAVCCLQASEPWTVPGGLPLAERGQAVTTGPRQATGWGLWPHRERPDTPGSHCCGGQVED